MSASCRPANKAPRSDHNDQLFWNLGCGFCQQMFDYMKALKVRAKSRKDKPNDKTEESHDGLAVPVTRRYRCNHSVCRACLRGAGSFGP
jgi:hypothetical protein